VKLPAQRMNEVVQQVEQEGVVACPAEAVWGLTCDPLSEDAVLQLLAMKHRPISKGLIIVAASSAMLGPLLKPLDSTQRNELELSWPGPNTWLVPNRGLYPDWITGESDEIAIRVTSAPALALLSYRLGRPVVSTSANPAGAQPARHSFQVVRYFGRGLVRAPGVVDLEASPSTIRRVGTGEVLRA
jgi:L-threonylcarbamoyladenylate synthase